MPRPTSDTITGVQILRALAALGVAFAHIPQSSTVFGGARYGAIGVDLFFVISGFIMVHSSEGLFGSREGAREFLLRRIARIVPLYWLLTFVLLLRMHWNADPSAVLQSLLFIPYGNGIPILGVGWTLNLEMFFYLVFAVAICFRQMTAIVVVTILLAAIAALGAVNIPSPFGLVTRPIVLEFVFGTWLGVAYGRGLRMPLPACIGLCLTGMVMFVAGARIGFYSTPALDNGRAVMWGLPSLLVVASVVLSRRSLPKTSLVRMGRLMGDASYAIYLAHPVLGFWILRRAWKPLSAGAAWVGDQSGLRFDPATLTYIAALGQVVTGLVLLVLIAIAIFIWVERPIKRTVLTALGNWVPALRRDSVGAAVAREAA